jgi:multidrug efflux pump subunit AcrA (membrane-fusion protein)
MKPKKAILILAILTIIGAIVIFLNLNKEPESIYTTTVAEIGDLVQTVSETGTVKAESELNLSFLNSGRISNIYKAIGDEVKQGDLLTELDFNDLEIKRTEAQASLDVSRSNLNKLLAGASDDDIAVSRAGLEQARENYESAKREMEKNIESVTEAVKQAEKTLSDLESKTSFTVTPKEQAIITAQTNLANAKNTYQKAIDNAVDGALITIEDKNVSGDTALDAINRVLTDEDADTSFSKKNPQYIDATRADYDSAKALAILAENALELAQASSSVDETLVALEKSYNFLNKVFSALSGCFNGLENTNTSFTLTQTELDAFKTSISSQQTLIASAIASVQTKEQTLDTAILTYNTKISEFEEAYSSAQTNYEQALIDARHALSTAKVNGEQQKTISESKVNNSYEAWLLAQAQLDKLLAPADKYDVNLAQAQVRQAEAALKSIDNQIEKSKIFAPINGIVTAINYEVGEPVSAGAKAVITLLGKNDHEIELLVSEADIAKVQTGNKSEITLDAYGEDIFLPARYFLSSRLRPKYRMWSIIRLS